MDIFWVSQSFKMETTEFGVPITYSLEAPAPSDVQKQSVAAGSLYVTIPSHLRQLKILLRKNKQDHLIQLLDPVSRDTIISHQEFPINLGYSSLEDKLFIPLDQKLARLLGKTDIRVAILGMGAQLGDSVVFQTAIRALRDKLNTYFKSVKIDLLQRIIGKTKPLFANDPFLDQVIQLPCTLETLMTYDGYISLEKMIVRPEFNTLPMLDFFLEAMSISKEVIPESMKRNQFILDQTISLEIEDAFNRLGLNKKQLLLITPQSTTRIRTMPTEIVSQLVDRFLDNSDYTIIILKDIGFIKHPRVIKLDWLSRTMDHFAAIISRMNAIVTVDTATYHIADAFSIPSVVLFTGINPDLRIKHYPTVRSLEITPKDGPLSGLHHSQQAKHNAYIHNQWKKQDLTLLTQNILTILSDLK